MSKKAQAAMEFLMTYGWALLVVIAAIGALAYFGVLKPDKFMPEQCVLVPGLACLDFKVTPQDTTFVISNSLGKDISINSITVGNCTQNFNQTLDNGDQSQFLIAGCNNGPSESKFKEDFIVDYTSESSSLSKKARGSLSAKIE